MCKYSNKRIYLAGGCFWGVEEYFSRINGVIEATSGYANGKEEEASYKTLSETDHAETVRVIYNPLIIKLENILEYYFDIIDPFSVNKQGNDIGRQYRTGIYYENEIDGEKVIDFLKNKVEELGQEVAVEVEPLRHFVKAEEYHQDYLKKNPGGYCHINLSNTPSGHVKENMKSIMDFLTEEEFDVTIKQGTEKPFTGEYNDHYEEGIYVDIISGEPLFSSEHKYDAGCGWPSFTRSMLGSRIDEFEDLSLGRVRTEIRSKAGSHLGHVFDDGPKEAGGKRYCVNSAAIRFIPKDKIEEEGYSKFMKLYEGVKDRDSQS